MQALKKFIYKWIEKHFLSGCSNYNSLQVRKSCRSKQQARKIFETKGIPHAKGLIFVSPLAAHRFARKHGFPLVIKPNVSGFSRGSYFPITSFYQLWKAAILVKVWWPTSVIEQYLEGKNYRVLVGRGKIVSVIRRYPPFVEGDSASTISQLIDQENSIRQKMKLYPVVHPIPKDRRITSYLRAHGLSLDSVPQKGERIRLYNKISLAPGGIVETIDSEKLPPDNQQLFLAILDAFGANVLGIDAIFETGIETSYTKQKCIFLEVNSRPYLKMHDVPRFGKKQDLAHVLEELERLSIKDADIF